MLSSCRLVELVLALESGPGEELTLGISLAIKALTALTNILGLAVLVGLLSLLTRLIGLVPYIAASAGPSLEPVQAR